MKWKNCDGENSIGSVMFEQNSVREDVVLVKSEHSLMCGNYGYKNYGARTYS